MASYVNYGRRRTRARFALSHVSAIAMFSAERLAKKFSDGEFRLKTAHSGDVRREWGLGFKSRLDRQRVPLPGVDRLTCENSPRVGAIRRPPAP